MSKEPINREKIEAIAKQVRKKFKMEYGIESFKNPFGIISELDGYILIRFKGYKKVQGLTVKKKGYKCIYINSDNILAKQNYSCWHEFYHSIDDRALKDGVFELSIDGSDEKIEREAEYFASCMLMDKQEVKNYVKKIDKTKETLDELDLIDMQYEFGVSYQALKNRLKDIYNTNKFYTFTINSIENEKRYIDTVLNKGYDLSLTKETKDFCIPFEYRENLLKCLDNKSMSLSKIEKTIKFLNDKGVEFKW